MTLIGGFPCIMEELNISIEQALINIGNKVNDMIPEDWDKVYIW